jgi:hypothetical protein
MIGIPAIRDKREIQWDRSQIRMLSGPIIFFFFCFFFSTTTQLYSDLNNLAVSECPNY